MVSRLRRPNAEMTIELTEGPHRLGQPISGRITLLPSESLQVREGNLLLICTETYLQKVRRTTRMGSAETEESSTTVLREISHPIFFGTEIANLVPYVSDLNVTLPLSAPPTVKGVVVDVGWKMRATLDVARARDITEEIEVVILPPPGDSAAGGSALSTQATSTETGFEACVLSISLDSSRVCVSETVRGVLKIHAIQDLNVASCKLELTHTERAGSRSLNRANAAADLGERHHLQAGAMEEWPFDLQVPECLLATISVHETQVAWRVRGTVGLVDGQEMEISQGIGVRGLPASRVDQA